jgi:hypothetical protein
MAWLSEAWASRLYDWANVAFFATLAVGVVATGVVIWSGKQKDAYLSQHLAEAAERAAQANRLAEQEHLARVRLEDKLAGWRLSAPAQSHVISAITRYAGTPYELSANPNEIVFMETMDSMLTAAGWNRLTPQPPQGLGINILLDEKARIVFVDGIQIEVAADRLTEWGPAVEQLRSALELEGILVSAHYFPSGQGGDSAVQIVIGRK